MQAWDCTAGNACMPAQSSENHKKTTSALLPARCNQTLANHTVANVYQLIQHPQTGRRLCFASGRADRIEVANTTFAV